MLMQEVKETLSLESKISVEILSFVSFGDEMVIEQEFALDSGAILTSNVYTMSFLRAVR